jgi:hypothetical protein
MKLALELIIYHINLSAHDLLHQLSDFCLLEPENERGKAQCKQGCNEFDTQGECVAGVKVKVGV